MSYQHHLFISYCWRARHQFARRDYFAKWVCEHFGELLRERIESELIPGPKQSIFIDRTLEPGRDYRLGLAQALKRSAILIPILDGQYFSSDWCKAEWDSFSRREEELRTGRTLIIPIHYSDGDCFTDDANIRKPFDMRGFSAIHSTEPITPKYEDFQYRVADFARIVAQRIKEAPVFSESWPEINYSEGEGSVPHVAALPNFRR